MHSERRSQHPSCSQPGLLASENSLCCTRFFQLMWKAECCQCLYKVYPHCHTIPTARHGRGSSCNVVGPQGVCASLALGTLRGCWRLEVLPINNFYLGLARMVGEEKKSPTNTPPPAPCVNVKSCFLSSGCEMYTNSKQRNLQAVLTPFSFFFLIGKPR